MAHTQSAMTGNRISRLACLTALLMLGACAETTTGLDTAMLDSKVTDNAAAKDAEQPKSELEKATEYWGKQYKQRPTELEPALSYAKNLKAMGERQRAMAVIQQSAIYHGNNKALASEYGRLALEMDQISIAKQMLAVADDPTNPDWRVISARGTVAAKEGRYSEAIPLYERALSLSQEQTSVMNNLAMAYAMAGDAPKAEALLRQIEAKGGTVKSRQNLALVLGLQGKFEEAKQLASKDMSVESAANDAAYLKRMVRLDTNAGSAVAANDRANAKPAKAVASAAIRPAVTDVAQSADTGPAKVAGIEPTSSPLKGMSPQ